MLKMFVDTSAWYAIADSSDSNHQSALTCRDQIARKYKLVVSNYILDELYTLLLIHISYRKAVDIKNKLDFLQQTNILEIVWIDQEICELTWQIFEKFNIDKQWSFTDCTSYVIMQKFGIKNVFTYDHHFSQIGYICHPN